MKSHFHLKRLALQKRLKIIQKCLVFGIIFFVLTVVVLCITKQWCCLDVGAISKIISKKACKTEMSFGGLTLETSAFKSLYGGQFTLSTQSINKTKLSCNCVVFLGKALYSHIGSFHTGAFINGYQRI